MYDSPKFIIKNDSDLHRTFDSPKSIIKSIGDLCRMFDSPKFTIKNNSGLYIMLDSPKFIINNNRVLYVHIFIIYAITKEFQLSCTYICNFRFVNDYSLALKG